VKEINLAIAHGSLLSDMAVDSRVPSPIATPNEFDEKQTVEAYERAVHVFVEVPLVQDSSWLPFDEVVRTVDDYDEYGESSAAGTAVVVEACFWVLKAFRMEPRAIGQAKERAEDVVEIGVVHRM
jgi:hypothetical protein